MNVKINDIFLKFWPIFEKSFLNLVIDAPKGVTCNEVTPVMPTTMITGQTLSTRSTNRPPLDIAASQSIDVQICKGQTLTVDAGEFYVLYIESILKGASNSPFCEDYK